MDLMKKAVGKRGKTTGFPKRSPSLESTSSIGGGKPLKRLSATDKPTEMPYGPYLFDCAAALIYCPRHNTLGLSRISDKKGFWMPYVILKPNEGWYAACCSRLRQVLSLGAKGYARFTQPELVHIFRLQLPGVTTFVTRVTFLSQLSVDEKTKCCVPGKMITWFPAEEVVNQNIVDLWGPEPSVFGEAFIQNAIDKGAYTEFTLRDAMRYLPRDQPKSVQDELLKSAQFTEREVSRLYSEFIQHCYPSQFMVFPSFVDYMTKLGFTSQEFALEHIYRAFGVNQTAYVSFHEFLLGLASMEKITHQGGHPGELRCGYIFRYYDQNGDGMLDAKEMSKMTYDMLRCMQRPNDDDSVSKELVKNYEALRCNVNEPISESALIRAVGTMTFRGTSVLFRAPFSIASALSVRRYGSLSQVRPMEGGKKPKGSCPACKTKKYSLAAHTLRLTSDGFIADPIEIADIAVKNRHESLAMMSPDNIANKMLDWLRDHTEFANLGNFRRTRRRPRSSNFWLSGDRATLTSAIVRVCSEVEVIFKREPRCLKVNSPIFVLGDTHGNFRDLMIYERILWRTAAFLNPTAYLFLGDFVDRGNFGLECVMYLFSCKLIAPERFWLVRGNHELRSIQAVFTFQRECLEKYGKSLGATIWEAVNRAFDFMPLCAVIDESIFCAHGGIPTSAIRLEDLASIPMPLSEPESQSPAAWEILWNDPVSGSEFDEYAEMLRLQSGSHALASLQGFLPNMKRGTAYCFNEEAVNKFLTINGLTHIIRAHEVVQAGYRFQMGGKVLTIFSSSRYCGGSNESACVFIDQERIRIVRFDTSC